MELEKQVCSLELSKKLLTLGVKQNSLFYWRDDRDCDDNTCDECNHKIEIIFSNYIFHENSVTLRDYYSAFTVSELVEMLPAEIGNPHLEMGKYRDGRYGIEYLCMDDGYTEDITFANACAKMLIHLLENKFIKIEDLK